MNKSSKYIILIILLGVFLSGVWQSCQAVDLLLDYPDIPGAGKIEEATGFPEFIRYIYMFALGAAGFVALLAMLIGAIMYIFSAGNASKAADAKDRILSAILGIIILLASVLILRTINPNLVEFGLVLPKIERRGDGENGGDGEKLKMWDCTCIAYKKDGSFCHDCSTNAIDVIKELNWCNTLAECEPRCKEYLEQRRKSDYYFCGSDWTIDGGCAMNSNCPDFSKK